MDLISGLNRDERIGFDPDTFNGLNRREVTRAPGRSP
jgi:hypothetical protein